MDETMTLESLLDSPDSKLFKDFANYLHQSYCLENLAFWSATQKYNDDPSLGKAMIHLYIRPNSPQEINIPCSVRQTILNEAYRNNYHTHLFDEALEIVIELMRVNSYLPWKSTKQKKLKYHSHPKRRNSYQPSIDSVNSFTRYKSILKRVKNTLLPQHHTLDYF